MAPPCAYARPPPLTPSPPSLHLLSSFTPLPPSAQPFLGDREKRILMVVIPLQVRGRWGIEDWFVEEVFC